jgi:hypothetical protein
VAATRQSRAKRERVHGCEVRREERGSNHRMTITHCPPRAALATARVRGRWVAATSHAGPQRVLC